MSYPKCQDRARKKEDTYGNIDALPILRRGQQPGGLGSRRGLLCPLWGNDRRNIYSWAGRAGGVTSTVGTGAGLATSHESCVVRLDCLPPWRGPVVPESRLDVRGWCRSFLSWQRSRLPSGGRWRVRRKITNLVGNGAPNSLGWKRPT